MASREEKLKELEELRGATGETVAAAPSRADKLAELQQLRAATGETPAEGPGLARQLEAGIEGFGRTATFGVSPQLQAGAEIGVERAQELFGAGPRAERERLEAEGFKLPPEPTFGERAQRFAGRAQRLKEEAPVATTVGEVGGFIAPGLGVARAAQAGVRGATALARAGQVAKGTAGLGAAQGIAETPLEAQLKGDLLDIEGRLSRAATGAVLGPVALGAGRVIAKAPKKLLSVFGGVRTDIIDKYLANPKAIAEAEIQGREAVEQIVLDAVAPIKRNLESATIDKKVADELLKQVDADLVTQFRREKKAAADTFKRATSRLNEAFKRGEDELKRVPPPTDISDQVAESIEGLKRQVINGSSEATDIIARELKTPVDVTPVYNNVDDAIEQLLVKDDIAAPGMAPVIDRLREFKSELQALGPGLDGRQIKRLIKLLDRKIEFNDVAGDFDEPVNQAAKSVRRSLDDILKSGSTTYDLAMQQVRSDAELLDIARRSFGKPDRRLAKLRQIDSDKNILDRETLELLGNRTGFDFKGNIDGYLQIKRQIKDLKLDPNKRKFLEKLPEFEDVEDAKKALDEVDFIDQVDLQEKVAADVRRQQFADRLQDAEARLTVSNEASDQIKGFLNADPRNKINQLTSVLSSGTDQGIKIRQEWQKLSKLTNQDLIQLVDNITVGEQFSKDFTRGSRNTNLWGAMAGASSTIITGDLMSGASGLGMGVAIGALIDKVGPQATRRVLNFVSSTKGVMTRFKLENAPIDGPSKKELLRMFDQAVLRGVSATEVIDVLPEDIPEVRKDIQTRPDLSNSDKAKILSDLNEKGEISQAPKYIGRPKSVESTRRNRSQ